MRKFGFLLFLFCFNAFSAPPKCIQIYYDRYPDANSLRAYGHYNAIFIRNLLGHFPEFQVGMFAVEEYQKGNLERCVANFYIGTTANNSLPADFLTDVLATEKMLVWVGYNLWQFSQSDLQAKWNVHFNGVKGIDLQALDLQGEPGFFRHFTYKGETFWKFGRWANSEKLQYLGSTDLVSVSPLDSSEVKSWAWHSVTNEKQPYVVAHQNRWIINDIPFQYTHDEDRYLIFADLLFDILKAKPKVKGKRPALIRFEDIHAALPQWQLDRVLEVTKKNDIEFTLSLIPQFEDPHMVLVKDPALKRIDMDRSINVMNFLKAAEEQKGSFLQHGTTHQFEEMKNPFSGLSGEDCEFWNCFDNRPIKTESVSSWTKRIEDGYAVLERAGAKPVGWLTPHYAASSLANVLVGQLFLWSVGRVNYQPAVVTQTERIPDLLSLDLTGTAGSALRLPYLENLTVEIASDRLVQGQFFPYQIEKDYYGIRIYPETLGFPGSLKTSVLRGRSVDDMIRILKRNHVLRDAWASFFVHPFLLGSSGGEEDENFARLIREVKALGYEFKNLTEDIKR